MVLKAECSESTITLQLGEIYDAKFIALTEENIGEYITRPHMQSRTLDAMRAEECVPYETWQVRPYNLIRPYGKEKNLDLIHCVGSLELYFK